MSREALSPIDRRVVVIEGPEEAKSTVQVVSDLRDWPYVVLLGEPGIGKSTVFKQQAAIESATLLTVRELINGAALSPDSFLFLDALDEYRSDGDPKDKGDKLANVLALRRPSPWRLSCRSEDWRATDLRRVTRAAVEGRVVVAQLEPLNSEEAAAMLQALGAPEPEAFLQEAEKFAAGALLENPLSLRLLYKTVSSSGSWPASRFDLFESAVADLAYEHDQERELDQRHPHGEILRAARWTCLLLLLSNASAVRRSNGPPSANEQATELLTWHDLDLTHDLVSDMLDTALFRGEGANFRPMHRTVAEFLAGKALARAVCGEDGGTRVPLQRAIAMIADADGCAPSALRGLFAWTAAHLARLENHEGALRLIDADAATVLAYGDAAVFRPAERRAILQRLDRQDPFFRASEGALTALGGLAGEDLSDDFRAILEQPSDETHRLWTVFDVLTYGKPVLSLRTLLRTIALNSLREGWERELAARAWIAGAGDKVTASRELFDAIGAEPISAAREALRIYLASTLPASHLDADDIRQVFGDYVRRPPDNFAGGLISLQMALEREPRPALFDLPLTDWLPDSIDQLSLSELDNPLQSILAATIRQCEGLSGQRLWHWLANLDESRFAAVDERVRTAVLAWMDVDPQREIDLFEAILDDARGRPGPAFATWSYDQKLGSVPSSAVVTHLLRLSDEMEDGLQEARLLSAMEIARRSIPSPDPYWAVVAYLQGCPERQQFLEGFTVCAHDLAASQESAEREHRREQARRDRTQQLRPILDQLAEGQYPAILRDGAFRYLNVADTDDSTTPRLSRVVKDLDEPTAEAIFAGWEYLATYGLGDVDARMLGIAFAESRFFNIEIAAMAGIDRLLSEARMPALLSIPIVVAVAVLKSSGFVTQSERRRRLEEWAVQRLEAEPEAGGAKTLLGFWESSLDTRDCSHICGIATTALRGAVGAAKPALQSLLQRRPSMPPEALRSAVLAAGKMLEPAELLQLANAALEDGTVVGTQREVWHLTALGIDPVHHGASFFAAFDLETVVGRFREEFSQGLVANSRALDLAARIEREAMAVRLFAASRSSEASRSPINDPCQRAITWLGQCSDLRSDAVLAQLVAAQGTVAWRSDLRHVLAIKIRTRHDREFQHPSVEAIRRALAGGPPVNAADLMAVVIDQLRLLGDTMQTGETSPWKTYWNTDRGRPVKPVVENDCRDRLLQQLQPRLLPFGVEHAVPEAQRASGTRADVLLRIGASANLPIEVKRHYHPEVWNAADLQLRGYAADLGASGHGILLVFWFGAHLERMPARRSGGPRPTTAAEMELMLRDDLPHDMRPTTAVVVLDVSDPNAPEQASSRKAHPARPPSNDAKCN